ncbi:MAG: pyruvate ferredoxin oxidoreductase [Candidatus Hydrothermota bacterium]|nr:MAG: pyruvate ferredoxin oxidoreductase [Candidatus Hydrothermae bacterium]
MSFKKVTTGNHAVSYAVWSSRVQVISAYPITPQTQIVELLSEIVAEGQLDAIFINVESEHSAMAACIGAAATGARAFTATSAQGLALMHEMLHWAAGARLPIVLANVNRAMAPPWSVWTDQNDALAQRDTGWMQIYNESNQEVYDSVIIGYKVAEQVRLPFMTVLDAFVLSHTSEPVEILTQEEVDEFLPPREFDPKFYSIDLNDPRGYGLLTMPSDYYEFRYKVQIAHEKALEVYKREVELFAEIFGRKYGVFEEFMLDDADYVLVTSATLTSDAKYAVKKLREKGIKIGVLKMRLFRPFPFEDIRRVLGDRKKVAVIDRNIGFGHHGIFYQEIKSALYPLEKRPPVFGYIIGIGGRDVTPADIEDIVDDMLKREEMTEIIWKGVRL